MKMPLRIAKPLIPLGMLAAGALGLISEIPAVAGGESSLIQYGALGILGLTIIGLFKVIDSQQKGYRELSDRWDSWEKVRHDDSKNLNDTLTHLSVTCSQRQSSPP